MQAQREALPRCESERSEAEDQEKTVLDGVQGAPAVEDREREELDAIAQITYPNGGWRAWVTVVGAGLLISGSLGIIMSAGQFLSYYGSHQLAHRSSSDIQWIGSFGSFGMSFGGVFVGPIFDTYGATKVVMPASIVLTFALFMISLGSEYYQFILAHFLLGLASSPVFVVPLSVTAQWFSTKRGTAAGLAISGGSWGAVIWPVILAQLFPKVGFGWAVRIVAFIILGILALGCLLTRSRLPPKPPGSLFDMEAFKRKDYIFTCAGGFFCLLCIYYGMFIVQDYGKLYNVGSVAPYLLAIINAGSGVGRIVAGMIADKTGSYNGIAFSAFAFSMVFFGWVGANSTASITIIAVLYGVFTGSFFSLQTPCVASIVTDPRKTGTWIGGVFTVQSFGSLVGPPISGAIYGAISSRADGYVHALVFNGVMAFCASICFLTAKLCVDRNFISRV